MPRRRILFSRLEGEWDANHVAGLWSWRIISSPLLSGLE
jgi:hypothetical protein